MVPSLDVGRLEAGGFLLRTSGDELTDIVVRNSAACSDQSTAVFTILPTAHCNMGCAYCGQIHRKGGLERNVYRAMVRRVSHTLQDGSTRAARIQWFGAEPMVAFEEILHMSRHFMMTARKANVAYSSSMVTNGSLLTVEKLLKLRTKAAMSELCITVDGPEKIHESRRRTLNGAGSYKQICGLLREVRCHPGLDDLTVTLRTNVDVFNEDHIDEHLSEMHRLGLNHPRFRFELLPVYSWDNDVTERQLTPDRYAALEVNWMIRMLQLGLNFSAVPQEAHSVVCVALKHKAEVHAPTGDVFTCTEHPLVPVHQKKGTPISIQPVLGRREEATTEFQNFNAEVHRQEWPCGRCVLFGVCGGACPKHWRDGNPPCPSFKRNMQARFDIEAVRAGYRIYEPEGR